MPLDFDRDAGLQDLVQEAVDVLTEGRSFERHAPMLALESYDCQS